MSLFKKILKNVSKIIPSPVTVDFKTGGGRIVQEVAPYPKEVHWDDHVMIHKTNKGIEFVRTPDAQFEELPRYSFNANYVDIDGFRMHYVDEGPKNGPTILLLHGQPSWSFLYRKMITPLVAKGYRCIAPDLIGMGKSDKPISEKLHTYNQHCKWILDFIKQIDLTEINLFCQDWGGVIGLRLVGENEHLFASATMANTDLVVYKEVVNPLYIPSPIVVNPKVKNVKSALAKYAMAGMPISFQAWINYCLTTSKFTASDIMQMATSTTLSIEELKAYNAPFPSFIYCAGPRTLPSMAAGIETQTQGAWEGLQKFKKPFLSIIGLEDKLLGRRSIQKKMIEAIPGAKGQQHEQYEKAHHFIQEDMGEVLAERMDRFLKNIKS